MTKAQPVLTIGVDHDGRSLATWHDAPGEGATLDAATLRLWGASLLETAERMDGGGEGRAATLLSDTAQMLRYLGQQHEALLLAKSETERVRWERLIEETRESILAALRAHLPP